MNLLQKPSIIDKTKLSKKWSKNTQNLRRLKGWDSRLQNCKRGLFGTEVMKQIGSRDKPGLPAAELRELKKAIFTQFQTVSKCPVEFESTWKKCLEASCKRLRLNNNFIFHLKTCILCLSCIHHVLLKLHYLPPRDIIMYPFVHTPCIINVSAGF